MGRTIGSGEDRRDDTGLGIRNGWDRDRASMNKKKKKQVNRRKRVGEEKEEIRWREKGGYSDEEEGLGKGMGTD